MQIKQHYKWTLVPLLLCFIVLVLPPKIMTASPVKIYSAEVTNSSSALFIISYFILLQFSLCFSNIIYDTFFVSWFTFNITFLHQWGLIVFNLLVSLHVPFYLIFLLLFPVCFMTIFISNTVYMVDLGTIGLKHEKWFFAADFFRIYILMIFYIYMKVYSSIKPRNVSFPKVIISNKYFRIYIPLKTWWWFSTEILFILSRCENNICSNF